MASSATRRWSIRVARRQHPIAAPLLQSVVRCCFSRVVTATKSSLASRSSSMIALFAHQKITAHGGRGSLGIQTQPLSSRSNCRLTLITRSLVATTVRSAYTATVLIDDREHDHPGKAAAELLSERPVLVMVHRSLVLWAVRPPSFLIASSNGGQVHDRTQRLAGVHSTPQIARVDPAVHHRRGSICSGGRAEASNASNANADRSPPRTARPSAAADAGAVRNRVERPGRRPGSIGPRKPATPRNAASGSGMRRTSCRRTDPRSRRQAAHRRRRATRRPAGISGRRPRLRCGSAKLRSNARRSSPARR